MDQKSEQEEEDLHAVKETWVDTQNQQSQNSR